MINHSEYNFKKYKNNPFFNRIKKHDPDGWVALAVLDRTLKKPMFRSHMVQESRDNYAYNSTLLKEGYCNYLGLNTFIESRRVKESVSNLSGFFFDFDDGDQLKIDRIINELGTPTWLINSTKSMNKWQLIYLFDSPVGAEEAANWEAKSKSLTKHFESDNVWDISRVMRLPLSVNGKNGEFVTIKDSGLEYSYWDYFDLEALGVESQE
jgi:hypothetical protein